jgi:4-amino-4-deoxy-L-arabinose transferase-like glycosyltransferase
MIWLAVLFAAVFGPDIKSVDAGGDASIIPSGVAVALFAVLATFVVAKYGFERARKS